MEKKYPVLKCNEELWNEIKPVLESFGVIDFNNLGYGNNKNDFQFKTYPYLVSNYENYYIDRFLIGNIDKPHVDEFNTLRYLVDTKEEFLSAVAKLLGKEYSIKEQSSEVKYPCIKCTQQLYDRIKDILKVIGYKGPDITSFEDEPILVINLSDNFGAMSNVKTNNINCYNRYLCSNIQEFLTKACELKGYTVSYKNNTHCDDAENHYFGYCTNDGTKTIDIYENAEEGGLQAIVVEKSVVPKKKFKNKKENYVVSYDPAVGESSTVVATIPAKDNDKDKGSDLDIDKNKNTEKINIANKLKHYKKGTKLYSPIFGEVEFDNINNNAIYVNTINNDNEIVSIPFESNGQFYSCYSNAECLLFPSKDNRDWNSFQVLEEGHRVMVSNDGYLWILRDYCYNDICSANNLETIISYKYIVPVEEFDFTAEDITVNKEKSII